MLLSTILSTQDRSIKHSNSNHLSRILQDKSTAQPDMKKAAQGLIAGINVLSIKKKTPFILDRSVAYIAVLISDLASHGVTETYRMFTSRAEHRLMLSQDTARQRLTHIANDLGLVNGEDFQNFQSLEQTYQNFAKNKATKHNFGKESIKGETLLKEQISHERNKASHQHRQGQVRVFRAPDNRMISRIHR